MNTEFCSLWHSFMSGNMMVSSWECDMPPRLHRSKQRLDSESIHVLYEMMECSQCHWMEFLLIIICIVHDKWPLIIYVPMRYETVNCAQHLGLGSTIWRSRVHWGSLLCGLCHHHLYVYYECVLIHSTPFQWQCFLQSALASDPWNGHG